MHRDSRKRPLAGGALIAIAMTLGLISANATAGEDLDEKRSQKQRIDAQLDDAHNEVLAFNKKISQVTGRVLQARGQLPAARARFEAAQAEKERTASAEAQARAELEEAAAAVLKAEERLAGIEGRIDVLKENVGDFARRAYQMGPFAEIEMVLEAKDPSEFTDRLAAIRSVSESNNATMGRMSENRADLVYTEQRLAALREVAQEKQQEAQARLAEAQAAADSAAAAKQQVDALIAQEEAALATAEKHRAEVKQEYRDLEDEQDRIQQQIAEAEAELERKRAAAAARAAAKAAAERAAAEQRANQGGGSSGGGSASGGSSGAAPAPAPPAGGGTGSGQWTFPLPGYSIGSNAGWRFHPILHYTRCHAGSDISAPSGTPIRAVDSGTVILAGWNGGYGNFTVISHGGGLTSGYGHQSRIAVSNGARVSRGQIIGYVGSTGLSTGPHLHFEARIDGSPYDPRGWFGTGSKSRVCV